MAEKDDRYPWVRQDEETHPAYEAFKVYMQVRTFSKTAEQIGKTTTMVSKWSARHNWVARVKAYDVYLETARTDGEEQWVVNARTETQQLADKLRYLLNEQLDVCISKRADPSVRWSQAAGMLIRMQEYAGQTHENVKMQEHVDRVAKMLEKITGERIT